MKGGPDFIDAAIAMVAKSKDKIIQIILIIGLKRNQASQSAGVSCW